MGDPVTMAVVGGSVGAMMNKKDPLKGAMIGAIGGYGGSSILGGAQNLASANIAAAAPSGTTGALAGGGSSAYYPMAGSTLANAGSSYAPIVSSQVTTSGAPLAVGTKTIGTAALPEPTFMQSMSQIPSAIGETMDDIGQYAQKNPVLTAMAAQTGQSLLQQPDRQLQSPGLIRGTPTQAQAPQYQLGIPKVSLI